MDNPKLVRLCDAGHFAKVELVEPLQDGFVLLAAQIDDRAPFWYFLESALKRRLISKVKPMLLQLEMQGAVKQTTLLKATVIPPGRGEYLLRRPGAHIARYDVAILLETRDLRSARQLVKTPVFAAIETLLDRYATSIYRMVGENQRRIGSVDYRDGAFLLNYFVAADAAQNIAVWEYTAGWFQQETGLDNSVLLRPVEQKGASYTIVNHCRWKGLRDILPALLIKPSFRRYVLRHFAANDTAAMPILYKRG